MTEIEDKSKYIVEQQRTYNKLLKDYEERGKANDLLKRVSDNLAVQKDQLADTLQAVLEEIRDGGQLSAKTRKLLLEMGFEL